jgi:DNA polymerase V
MLIEPRVDPISLGCNTVVLQIELDPEQNETADRQKSMKALDVVNQRFGRGTLHIASAVMAGDKRVWSMKQERRTLLYTTRKEDILRVQA